LHKNSIKFERKRIEMVRKQIEVRGVSDPKVLEAMRKVPRHHFVSEALWDAIYRCRNDTSFAT
jgi:protein-L-isoaspartate(D-aspartate) O-methyltransferase